MPRCQANPAGDAGSDDQLVIQFFEGEIGKHRPAVTQGERGRRSPQADRVIEGDVVEQGKGHRGGEGIPAAGGVNNLGADGGNVPAGVGGGVTNPELRQRDEHNLHPLGDEVLGGFHDLLRAGRIERAVAEESGFGDVGGDQVQFGEIRRETVSQQGRGGIGENRYFGAFRQREGGAQRFGRQVGIQKEQRGRFEEVVALPQIFGGDRCGDVQVVERELELPALIHDADVGSGGMPGGGDDGLRIHAGRGGMLQQLAAKTVIPYGGDERHGLPQAGEVLGNVAGHPAKGKADMRRVGGAGVQLLIEYADHVNGRRADGEDGGIGGGCEGHRFLMG